MRDALQEGDSTRKAAVADVAVASAAVVCPQLRLHVPRERARD